MKKIGLTGVMGAGKSSVIAILKENNIPYQKSISKSKRAYKNASF